MIRTNILLSLFVFTFSIPCFAKKVKFPEIHAIKGVSEVEYLSPFLLVKIRQESEIPYVCQQVEAIVAGKRDPDLADMDREFQLRCYDSSQYKKHKRAHKLKKAADSFRSLKELYGDCVWTAIYTLSWDSEYLIQSQDLRYPRNGSLSDNPGHAKSVPHSVIEYVESFRSARRKPDKLITFFSPYVGPINFPVYRNQIIVNGYPVPLDFFIDTLQSKKQPKAKKANRTSSR